jgi:hypothetical protein
MRLACEHRIPTTADDFWSWIHGPEFEAEVAKSLGLAAYEELERRQEAGGETYRKIRLASRIPSSLAPLVSRLVGVDRATAIEEQWRSGDRRVVRWRITPEILSERITVSGELRVEPAGERACRRILDGEIRARIVGVGGLIERAAVREVLGAYDVSARAAADFAKRVR